MKYFLFCVLAICSMKSLAQDSQLFEDNWYLTNVIIDGNDNPPPVNPEVELVPAIFTEPNFFDTWVCNSFLMELDFSDPNEFVVTDFSATLIFCDLTVNLDFEALYFGFFIDETTQEPYTGPFLYDIEVDGTLKTLTISNPNGDQAIYGNEILSVDDITSVQLSVSPNPVHDTLFVECDCGTIENVTFFDANGKKVKEYGTMDVFTSHGIDLSPLYRGIYFLKILTDKGTVTKKIIKG